MNRRLNIGMDCVKSLERDDGGVRPGAAVQRSGIPCTNDLVELAVLRCCISGIDEFSDSSLVSDRPHCRAGDWKTPELKFSRQGSRQNKTKNKTNSQTKGIVLCHS